MAIKINLTTLNAFKKAHAGYKITVDKSFADVYLPDGLHVNRQGETHSMAWLARLLIAGNPAHNMPPRAFDVDVDVLRPQLEALVRSGLIIKKIPRQGQLPEIKISLDLQRIADEATRMVRQWLIDGTYYRAHAPNAPTTIRIKGSDVPLVDTGLMVNSITNRVVRR